MSNKKLLSEAQVRRFMGLAGLTPLNENMYEEEEMEAAEEPAMDAEEAPVDAEMPPMADDAPAEEASDVDVEVDEEKVMKGLQGLKDGLEVLEDIAAGAGLDLGAEDAEELPAEEPMEEEPPAELDAEEPAEEEEEMAMMEAELAEVNMELSEEEIVNEVARRVAKRIVEAKRAHKKMNEALGRKK
jgi:hypothetical protein